jgi:hypothetical protein
MSGHDGVQVIMAVSKFEIILMSGNSIPCNPMSKAFTPSKPNAAPSANATTANVSARVNKVKAKSPSKAAKKSTQSAEKREQNAHNSIGLEEEDEEGKEIQKGLEDLKVTSEPGPLTLDLIRRRCLPPAILASNDKELINDNLLKLERLYLDGLKITQIDALELFNSVTHIYLQRNLITQIENLEFSRSLKFLVLSNNQITEVSALKSLEQLEYLDLRHNLIEDFDPDELPENLLVLDMRGNNCTAHEQYLAHCLANLPYCLQLDGQKISKQQRRELDLEVSDDESEPEEQAKELVNIQQSEISVEVAGEQLHHATEGIIQRSKQRLQEQQEQQQQKDTT